VTPAGAAGVTGYGSGSRAGRWALRRFSHVVALIAGAAGPFLLGGCLKGSVPADAFDRGTVRVDCCDAASEVELTYLGVGGFLIRAGGSALLTAPLFSNPGLFETGLRTIRTDPDRIAAHLPDVSDVTAILVGHGHYDHLMDVPWVLEHAAPRATVYANRTSAHQLAPFGFRWRWAAATPAAGVGAPAPPGARVVALNRVAGSVARAGAWLRVAPRMRIMALRSDHAPHLAGHVLYSGERRRDMPGRPVSAEEWLDGETLAFLIDVLAGDGSVELRIYYQDAVAAAPYGFAPPLERPVDVAIVVPATFAEVAWQPEALLDNLEPRHVILAHWEDFFRAPSRPAKPVPFTDLPDFTDRLARALPEGVRYDLPVPGTRFVVR